MQDFIKRPHFITLLKKELGSLYKATLSLS